MWITWITRGKRGYIKDFQVDNYVYNFTQIIYYVNQRKKAKK